jgi:hypothetical protein
MIIETEDEEKMGDPQEIIDAEHEEAHSKEPSNRDLVEAYKEEMSEKREEEAKKWKSLKDKAIAEDDKYMKRRG